MIQRHILVDIGAYGASKKRREKNINDVLTATAFLVEEGRHDGGTASNCLKKMVQQSVISLRLPRRREKKRVNIWDTSGILVCALHAFMYCMGMSMYDVCSVTGRDVISRNTYEGILQSNDLFR